MPKKVALLIGVSQYEAGLPPLLAAPNDVEAMRRVLQDPNIGGIDRLWVKYSEGRFGFSVQKRIWESVAGKPGEYDYENYS